MECCLGTRLSHAAICWPQKNRLGSVTIAALQLANDLADIKNSLKKPADVTGPMTVMNCFATVAMHASPSSLVHVSIFLGSGVYQTDHLIADRCREHWQSTPSSHYQIQIMLTQGSAATLESFRPSHQLG
jgi:hypothetical protein